MCYAPFHDFYIRFWNCWDTSQCDIIWFSYNLPLWTWVITRLFLYLWISVDLGIILIFSFNGKFLLTLLPSRLTFYSLSSPIKDRGTRTTLKAGNDSLRGTLVMNTVTSHKWEKDYDYDNRNISVVLYGYWVFWFSCSYYLLSSGVILSVFQIMIYISHVVF